MIKQCAATTWAMSLHDMRPERPTKTCALSLSTGQSMQQAPGLQRAFARNVCSSGPAVEEPDLPSLTKTATARSP
jgi:hypothetical protein